MTTKVQAPKSFQDRMMDRIKESMGELLTDEELSLLVSRGVEEVFFKERTVSTGFYNTKSIPPLIHEVVKECLSEQVRKAVDDHLATHKDELIPIIKHQLKVGVGEALIQAITNKFSGDLATLQINIEQRLRNN